MKALVTGGNGFLGRYIVEKLLGRGDQVRVFGRRRYPELEKMGVETVQGDIRDPVAVRSACKNMDTVFHVAALPSLWAEWKEIYSINVRGTVNVIDGCRQEGVPRLVFTSTASVVFDGNDLEYIDETVPYPKRFLCSYVATKAAAEKLVISQNGKQGILTVALRPHLILGPRDPYLVPALIERTKSGNLVRVGNEKNKVGIIYVEDAADAHIQAADRLVEGSPVGGQSYFISQEQPVILWEFLDRLLEKLGIEPVKKTISYQRARLMGLALEAAYTIFRLKGEPRITRFLAAQLAKSFYFNISRAKNDFGFSPAVSTDECLDRIVEYFRR